MIFDPLHTTVLFCVGIVGGALSAIAGGASFFTFPALIYVGLPPIIANTTNFVGLVPGNVTALPAYWAEIKRLAPLLLRPIIITIFGGAGGSILLLTVGGSTFETLIPWLMAFATLMFAIGPYIHVWVNRRRTTALSIKSHSAFIIILVMSIYGGYFGAGLGVICLAALSLVGFNDIHEANAVKNLLIALMSLIASGIYIASGTISWSHGLPLFLGTMIGGYWGGKIARRTSKRVLRAGITCFGVVLTLYYFWKS